MKLLFNQLKSTHLSSLLPTKRNQEVNHNPSHPNKMKSKIFLFLLLLIIQINIKISKAAFATPSSTVFQDIKTRLHQKQPNERNIQTTVKYVGHDRTPVVVLDDLLSHDHYLVLRDSLRTRTDFYEGHGNQVNFPGRIAELDRLTVDPLVDALLSSEVLSQHFPPNIFDKEHVGGFASILCNPWGIHNGIHHDFADTQYENIKAPAAVFYFGFDGAKSQSKSTTGTAFFREKISGLERATSIDGNEKEFCKKYPLSMVCPNTNTRDQEPKKDIDIYDETDRVVGQPNRLVLYPQDLLHKAWVETNDESDDNAVLLPCSPMEGRLAISLFFLRPEELIDDLQNKWKNTATQTLSGEVDNQVIENQNSQSKNQPEIVSNGGYDLPPHTHKNECEIDAIDFNQLTVSLFIKLYFGKKPVLIRNGVANWIAQTKWTKAFMNGAGLGTATPTLESFLNRLSDNVEPSVSKPKKEKPRPKTKEDEQYAFEKLLNERGHALAGANINNDTSYLFRRLHHGQLSYNAKSMDEDVKHASRFKDADVDSVADPNFATFNVMRDISVPDIFLSAFNISDLLNERSNSGSLDYFLSIGNQNTGLSFHKHSEAWNGLIWGRKRWFIVPKTHEQNVKEYDQFIDKTGREKWLNEIYPTLSKQSRPRQCWQEKGDLMYVPNNTIHAVWNEGEVMAVSSLYHSFDELNLRGYDEIKYHESEDVKNNVKYHSSMNLESLERLKKKKYTSNDMKRKLTADMKRKLTAKLLPPTAVSVRFVTENEVDELVVTIEPPENGNANIGDATAFASYKITSDIIGTLSFLQTSTHFISAADRTNSQISTIKLNPVIALMRIPEESTFTSDEVTRNGVTVTSREVTSLAPLNGGAFSFSAWVKWSNQGVGYKVSIFDIGEANKDNVFLACDGSSKKMIYTVRVGDGSSGQTITTTKPFPDDYWVLVQLLHRVDETVSLYWDGVMTASGSSFPLPLVTTSPRTWFVGKSHNWQDIDFGGSMKEVVFFNTEMIIGCYDISGEWSTLLGDTVELKQAGCVGSSENEDGDELIMQVTGATATVLCFETAKICDQGTISHDGKTIKWTSGESYTKQIVRELITWNTHYVKVETCDSTNLLCSRKAKTDYTHLPFAPTSASAHVKNDNELTLTIDPPLDDGGMDIIRYEIAIQNNAIDIGCDETYTGTGGEYRGCQDRTKTGKICQRFAAQLPREHPYQPYRYPKAGLVGHNYCRNPEPMKDVAIWCYTTTGDKRWDYCDPLPQQYKAADGAAWLALEHSNTNVWTISNTGIGLPPKSFIFRACSKLGCGTSLISNTIGTSDPPASAEVRIIDDNTVEIHLEPPRNDGGYDVLFNRFKIAADISQSLPTNSFGGLPSQVASGLCEDSGMEKITSVEDCQATAETLGVTQAGNNGKVYDGSYSYMPKGCLSYGNNIYYNSYGSSRDCQYSATKYCICNQKKFDLDSNGKLKFGSGNDVLAKRTITSIVSPNAGQNLAKGKDTKQSSYYCCSRDSSKAVDGNNNPDDSYT